MTSTEISEKLKANGWKEQSTAELDSNSLNKEVKIYFTYKDKLSFRFHEAENFIRLMIYGKAANEGFKVDYIKNIDKVLDKLGHNDVRGLQIEAGTKTEEILNEIISNQEEISLESYFTVYMKMQSVGDVSILAVEQFV
jgi:hypothetical protein